MTSLNRARLDTEQAQGLDRAAQVLALALRRDLGREAVSTR